MLHGIREGVIAVDARGRDQRDQRRGAAAAGPRVGPRWASGRGRLPPAAGCAGSSPARSAAATWWRVTDEHLLVLTGCRCRRRPQRRLRS